MNFSRHRAVRSLSQLPQTPRRLAGGSAELARAASPQALEHLLRSPVRRLVLDAVFRHAARQLGRSRSGRPDTTVRCHVIAESPREPDIYELRFHDGGCRVARGAGDAKAEVTVALDDSELVSLLSGRSTPVQSVLNGRIMVRGDFARLAGVVGSMFLTGRGG